MAPLSSFKIVSGWVILALVPIFYRYPKIRTLVCMLLHAILSFVLICLDTFLPLSWLLCLFPRKPSDTITSPRLRYCKRYDWIQSHRSNNVTKLDHFSVQLEPRENALEPEKEALRSPLVLKYDKTNRENGQRTRATERYFVKCGSAQSRGLPLWLVALSSYSANREVLFYRRIRPLLRKDVSAPRAILAAEFALLARWCLVITDLCKGGSFIEYTRNDDDAGPQAQANSKRRKSRSPPRTRQTEYDSNVCRSFVVPDRTGCSLSQALEVVRTLAKLHATFYGIAHLEPALKPLTAPRDSPEGYQPAPAVALLLKRALPKLPKMQRLWKMLLASRLKDATTTMLHGDCRPENLLFHCYGDPANADKISNLTNSLVGNLFSKFSGWQVSLLDWEAIGVNPGVNDLVYFITVGLPSKLAAEHEETLVEMYCNDLCIALEGFNRASEPTGIKTDTRNSWMAPESEGVHAEYRLMGVVFLIIQACFATADIFKGWGNNKRNLVPWMVRLCKFAQRLDVSKTATLLAAEDRAEAKEILKEMKERASKGLEKLAEEHGREVVERY